MGPRHINSLPEYISGFSVYSQNKKKISEMKTLSNHSQLKDRRIHLKEKTWNRPLQPIRTKFKKEMVKILKEIRTNMKELKEDVNGNADDFETELENTMRSLEKLVSSFSEMQAD